MPPNVTGDGQTDDTAAIQVLLDAAAKTSRAVTLPARKYLLHGSLNIPTGVALAARGARHTSVLLALSGDARDLGAHVLGIEVVSEPDTPVEAVN